MDNIVRVHRHLIAVLPSLLFWAILSNLFLLTFWWLYFWGAPENMILQTAIIMAALFAGNQFIRLFFARLMVTYVITPEAVVIERNWLVLTHRERIDLTAAQVEFRQIITSRMANMGTLYITPLNGEPHILKQLEQFKEIMRIINRRRDR